MDGAHKAHCIFLPYVAKTPCRILLHPRPQLVPVLSLGRRVVTQAVAGGTDGGLSIVPAPIAAGGPQLQATMLTPALFAAAAMVKVKQDLAKMKVSELKEELKVRKLTTTGAKPWLRRRLHAAMLSGRF